MKPPLTTMAVSSAIVRIHASRFPAIRGVARTAIPPRSRRRGFVRCAPAPVPSVTDGLPRIALKARRDLRRCQTCRP